MPVRLKITKKTKRIRKLNYLVKFCKKQLFHTSLCIYEKVFAAKLASWLPAHFLSFYDILCPDVYVFVKPWLHLHNSSATLRKQLLMILIYTSEQYWKWSGDHESLKNISCTRDYETMGCRHLQLSLHFLSPHSSHHNATLYAAPTFHPSAQTWHSEKYIFVV